METVLPSAVISGNGPSETAKLKWPSLWLRPLLWENRIGRGREKGVALGEAVLRDRSPAPIEFAESQSDSWAMRILETRSDQSTDEMDQGDVSVYLNRERRDDLDTESIECEGCSVDDEKIDFDEDTFSTLLTKVPLSEAKTYALLSNLGNLAYCIPRMKEKNKLDHYGFHFITSSFDERGLTDIDDEHELPPEIDEEEKGSRIGDNEDQISESAAYRAVASAASYLYSRGDIGSLRATSDSVTCVVAAEEEVKQAVANDLNSTKSCPCEWYICDDDEGTRYLVIQGSETLASWKANLLFEPAEFEGTGILVHRGIYEAAKGIYDTMIDHVRAHIESKGNYARFRFTGHSLGGSLSVLLNLMLLIRGGAPASSLLPVVTFGAPSVMCGGDELLSTLRLTKSHVKSVTMHRDIVPRAFSCHYPSHVARLLKAVNGRFRSHPCLNSQSVLYAPMGDLLILQPDESLSPKHDLLPEGRGLYRLQCTPKREKQAVRVFMNTPHPLEILFERSAYGDGGTIQRDHDMNSYVRCIRNVVRQEQKRVRRPARDESRPLRVVGLNYSIDRLTRFVASRHVNVLLLLLLPVRLLMFTGLDLN